LFKKLLKIEENKQKIEKNAKIKVGGDNTSSLLAAAASTVVAGPLWGFTQRQLDAGQVHYEAANPQQQGHRGVGVEEDRFSVVAVLSWWDQPEGAFHGGHGGRPSVEDQQPAAVGPFTVTIRPHPAAATGKGKGL
jgi:hypothetical protein